MAARGECIGRIVHCRDKPIRVRPLPGLDNTVSEEDLVSVLCAALPWWNPPPVPSAFHELKLWGAHFRFTKDMFGVECSGDSLIKTVLSDNECRTNTVAVGGNYLLDSPFGIRVVLSGTPDAIEYRGEGHYGQLLKLLAEVEVPSDAPVTTSSGHIGTIEDLYQDAVLQYSLSRELEFMGCALAYWHPPASTWQDQFGEDHSFDELLWKLIATPYGVGACGGTHVPYAVATILRVNEEYPIISEGVSLHARHWLLTLGHFLEKRWSETAGWDQCWARPAGYIYGNDLLDRIAVTGHHLEWMALAPRACRPSEQLIKRAATALRADIASLPAIRHRSFKSLLPVGHGARALALLRGVDAFTVWLKYWNAGRLKLTESGFRIEPVSKRE
jgi:hypothetical protein